MRSGILVSLIVVALCACVTGVERPAQISPGDILIIASGSPDVAVLSAGDPNATWDPNAHLAATWESVAVNMTSRIYNPEVEPDREVEGPQWSLSVASIVDITDSNGLIGWSTSPTSVQAFDPDGRAVSSSESSNSLVRWYQQPWSWSRPAGFPDSIFQDRFSLNLPVDPNVTYPESFSKVEWTMNVLVARETRTVDIPFKVSDAWTELIPGFEVMVEQATVEEGKYEYRIKVQFDSTKVDSMMSGSIHLWNDEALPPAAVLRLDILNAEGKSIRDLGGSGGFSSGNGTDGSSGSGSCDACGTAATFRYTFAFDLYEVEARFTLGDIPLPEF